MASYVAGQMGSHMASQTMSAPGLLVKCRSSHFEVTRVSIRFDPIRSKKNDPNNRSDLILSPRLARMVDLPAPIQKVSLSQSCAHRNSVQNAPIESSTALTGTTFVTISVFMSRGHFPATFGQLLVNFRATFGQQKRAIRNVSKKSRP